MTTEPITHFDDEAIDDFAEMMKEKMAISRAKGRSGWNDPKQCSVEYLNSLLLEHVKKGDPVDVANFCMMLRHYKARITVPPISRKVQDELRHIDACAELWALSGVVRERAIKRMTNVIREIPFKFSWY